VLGDLSASVRVAVPDGSGELRREPDEPRIFVAGFPAVSARLTGGRSSGQSAATCGATVGTIEHLAHRVRGVGHDAGVEHVRQVLRGLVNDVATVRLDPGNDVG